MKTGKVWGSSVEVLRTPFCEMHVIEIVPWSRCSKHKHQYKYNLFYVQQGELLIKTYKEGGLIDETLLQEGQWTSVAPNEYHEFQTRDQSCVAVELYYPQGIRHDITREDQGGKISREVFTQKDFVGVIQDLDE